MAWCTVKSQKYSAKMRHFTHRHSGRTGYSTKSGLKGPQFLRDTGTNTCLIVYLLKVMHGEAEKREIIKNEIFVFITSQTTVINSNTVLSKCSV